ncbi:MAG: N-acetylmuramoyl-L-alanine amidase [Gammaproteobacteria bacterium]|nr:N-acetylmuramoyl-L-alanine amidase [Gammaproteobacteria bacterium]
MKALLTLLLLFPSAALAMPVAVQGVQFAQVKGYTEVVFALSGPVEHSLFTLSHPDRIVIDMDDARLATAAPAGQGVVTRIRSAPHQQTGLRVVLDLSERVIPRSFLRQTPAGPQLVVDLYGAGQTEQRQPVLSATTPTAAANRPARDIVVAIDAGHGGIDSGARGPHGVVEKTVTLAIARKLAALIARQPGFKPFLTRDGDYYLQLRERIARARAAHADIFISIHCDASRDHGADGATVYALSEHGATSEHARWLANQENDADLLGGVSLANKSNMLASVLLDLSQTATISASLDVGGRVAHQLAGLGPMHRGDVQQAAFVVLKSPDIPSILVETDYITNPREARQLMTPAYQNRIARAIVGGVVNYFDQYPPPGTELALLKTRRARHAASAIVAGGAPGYTVASSGDQR